MKPNANVWKLFCLALVLALVLCPGAWGEAPAEKAPTDEIDDGPHLGLGGGIGAGAFLFVLLPLYFRYHTMRYAFDEEGVHMRWGILFRKEINLTYARIQDIHITSGPLQRWLGLANVHARQLGTARARAAACATPCKTRLLGFVTSL